MCVTNGAAAARPPPAAVRVRHFGSCLAATSLQIGGHRRSGSCFPLRSPEHAHTNCNSLRLWLHNRKRGGQRCVRPSRNAITCTNPRAGVILIHQSQPGNSCRAAQRSHLLVLATSVRAMRLLTHNMLVCNTRVGRLGASAAAFGSSRSRSLAVRPGRAGKTNVMANPPSRCWCVRTSARACARVCQPTPPGSLRSGIDSTGSGWHEGGRKRVL